MDLNEDKQANKLMIQKLQEAIDNTNQAHRERNRELIHEVVNLLMLPQIQEIIDRQDEALNRCERNRKKIKMIRQDRLKNLGNS